MSGSDSTSQPVLMPRSAHQPASGQFRFQTCLESEVFSDHSKHDNLGVFITQKKNNSAIRITKLYVPDCRIISLYGAASGYFNERLIRAMNILLLGTPPTPCRNPTQLSIWHQPLPFSSLAISFSFLRTRSLSLSSASEDPATSLSSSPSKACPASLT